MISAVVIRGMTARDIELAARTEVFKTHLCYVQSRLLNTSTAWHLQLSNNFCSLYKKETLPSEYCRAVIACARALYTNPLFVCCSFFTNKQHILAVIYIYKKLTTLKKLKNRHFPIIIHGNSL